MHDHYVSQGDAALAQGNFPAADSLFRQALAENPNSIPARRGLGFALFQMHQLAAALELIEAVVQEAPSDLLARHLFGRICLRLQEPVLAEKQFQRILKKFPTSAAALSGLVDVALARNQLKEAEKLTQRLLALYPKSEVSLLAASTVAGMLQQPEKALQYLRQLIQVAPQNPLHRYHLSRLLLRLGQLREGWQAYESRFACGVVQFPRLNTPRWTGETTDHLLLVAEQGLGDAIQFARFIERSKPIAKKITLACAETLSSLFRRSLGIDTISLANLISFPHETHLPLMSLPHVLELGEDALQPVGRYLQPASDKLDFWESRIRPNKDGRLKIGLVYACSTAHSTEANPITRRSCPPADMVPYFSALSDCDLFCLQTERQQEAIDAGLVCTHIGCELADFKDTVAAVDVLDGLISIDTATAHVAGALGKPLALLLPNYSDWRWMEAPTTTCWYPSATLLRQAAPGNWETPLNGISTFLDALRP